MKKTKTLSVTCSCMCVYSSTLEVPAELSEAEAIEYAKEHLPEVPLGQLTYVEDSDVLDEDNTGFED